MYKLERKKWEIGVEFWLRNHCWVHQQAWRDLCGQCSKPRPAHGQEYSLMVELQAQDGPA